MSGLTRAALIFATCSLAACKAPMSRAPREPQRLDDLASIEDALNRNASELRGQGITIPEPQPEPDAATEPAPEPPAAPPTEITVTDDDGEDAPESAEFERDVREESPPAPTSIEGSSVRKKRSSRSRRANRKDQADRCERLCDLAAATCDLADRICDLANEHVDDVRYEDACDRAEIQCEAAADACNACS